MASIWFLWPFQWMAYLLVTDKYSPEAVRSDFTHLPTLVVHGIDDPIVPITHGRQLFAHLQEPKCLWEISSSSHGNLMNDGKGAYRRKMLEFFETGKCPN